MQAIAYNMSDILFCERDIVMAKTANLYVRTGLELKFSYKRLLDMSALSRDQLNTELEKGYTDMAAGRTKPARAVFATIRKDDGL